MPTAPCLALASVLALLFWPSGASCPGAFGAERGRHGVGHHRDRARAVHDAAGTCPVLRRAGACAQPAVRADALLLDLLPGLGALAGGRLQPGVRSGQCGHRRPRAGIPGRRRHRNPRGHGARGRVLHVPDDLRDHHAGADRRRLSRAHHLSGGAVVQRHLAAPGVRPGRPLDLGRRLARRAGRHGLRRRAGRPPHRGRRPRWCSPWCSAPGAAFPTSRSRRTAPG